jgi:hypothetical protein
MFFPNPEQNIRQRQDGSDDGRLPAVRILAVLRELGNHVSRDNLNKPATKTARQSPAGLVAVVELHLSLQTTYQPDVSQNIGETNMTIQHLAEALAIRCTVGELAELINATLAADDDERLTDEQAEAAGSLHQLLCELKPDAMHLAQIL